MPKILTFLPLLSIILTLEALGYIHLLPRLFLVTPSEIILSSAQIWNENKLPKDLWTTFFKTLIGLGLGSLFGITTGLIIGINLNLQKILFPYIDFLRSILVVALYSIFILLLGINDNAKIATIVWGVTFIMALNTFYGVVYISKVRQATIQILKLDLLTKILKVIIPVTLPSIISGLRTSASYALVLSIVSEMFLGSGSGIGKRILDSQLSYEIPTLYFYIILSGIVGYGLNRVLVRVEKKAIFWV